LVNTCAQRPQKSIFCWPKGREILFVIVIFNYTMALQAAHF